MANSHANLMGTAPGFWTREDMESQFSGMMRRNTSQGINNPKRGRSALPSNNQRRRMLD
jgi:hypothetical protein